LTATGPLVPVSPRWTCAIRRPPGASPSSPMRLTRRMPHSVVGSSSIAKTYATAFEL
jgi:hypothetical protein